MAPGLGFLGHQALEEALRDLWRGRPVTQGVERCSMRTQLLCLPTYLDPGLAVRVGWAWSALSQACHHHAYDIAPTAAELRRWLEVVADLVVGLSTAAQHQGAGDG